MPEQLKNRFNNYNEAASEERWEIGRFAIGENRFLSISRKIENTLPTTRLNIVIEDGDGRPIFDFSQFAPITEGRFAYYKDEKTKEESISVNSQLMASDPREIMALLHEIGHKLNNESLENDDPEKLQRRDIAYKSYEHERQPLPGATEAVLDEERDAWAKGIRLARKIKNEHGVDLFKLFKSPDEFFVWMRFTGLRDYEIDAEKRGKISISGNARIRDWSKKNPGTIEKLATPHIFKEDIFWRTAREKEATDYAEYIKQNYPDLYSEAENINK